MEGDADWGALERRLARVEERLAELEAVRGALEHTAGVDADEVEFWALEELKSRTAEESAVLFTGSVRLPSKAYYEWQQTFDVGSLLEADWTLVADVLAALGQPVRLMLLRQVLLGIETVSELGALEGLGTTGQLYHHLRALVAAGWLRTAGRGRYRVPAARVVPLLVVLAAAQR